jgi:hypothetical protein
MNTYKAKNSKDFLISIAYDIGKCILIKMVGSMLLIAFLVLNQKSWFQNLLKELKMFIKNK